MGRTIPAHAHLLIPSSTMQQLQLSARREANMPSWSVTLPASAAERATAKFIRGAIGEIWYRDLRPRSILLHTASRQNNSSHTSMTTAGPPPQ
eukprot:CCRYP_015801-RA/>CCRYP_015801-RA protein AED:0.39 eAED:0.39 QI:308/-1/1/1/-1/1/1/0/92